MGGMFSFWGENLFEKTGDRFFGVGAGPDIDPSHGVDRRRPSQSLHHWQGPSFVMGRKTGPAPA